MPVMLVGWATVSAARIYGRVAILKVTDTQSIISREGYGRKLSFDIEVAPVPDGGGRHRALHMTTLPATTIVTTTEDATVEGICFEYAWSVLKDVKKAAKLPGYVEATLDANQGLAAAGHHPAARHAHRPSRMGDGRRAADREALGLMARTHPYIQVSVGGQAVGPAFYDRLSKATITDATGQDSDRIELVFDDAGNAIAAPSEGALLAVQFGYRDVGLWRMGLYTVEQIGFEGGESGETLTLTGRSADMRSDLKEPLSEHFDDDTVGGIIEKLAARHGLQAKVSPELAGRKVPYIARVEQSTIDFGTRLADRNGALFSVKGGKMLLVKRGEVDMGSLTIARSDCASWSFETDPRPRYGSTEARWFDRETGEPRFEDAVDRPQGTEEAPSPCALQPGRGQERRLVRSPAPQPGDRLRRDRARRDARGRGRDGRHAHRLPARDQRPLAGQDRHPRDRRRLHHQDRAGGARGRQAAAMTIYIGTNPQGDGVTFEAPSWPAAEARCEAEGWQIAGEFKMEVPVGPAFTETDIEALCEQRNRWGLS